MLLCDGSSSPGYTLYVTGDYVTATRPSGVSAPPSCIRVPEAYESGPDDFKKAFGPMSSGVVYAGTADASATIDSSDYSSPMEYDWYYFYVSQTSTVTIGTTNHELLSDVYVYTAATGLKNTWVDVERQFSCEHPVGLGAARLGPGLYYVCVERFYDAYWVRNNDYTITVTGPYVTTKAPTVTSLDTRTIYPAYGSAFSLSGRLMTIAGAKLAGRPVQLQVSTDAGVTWKTFATVTTGSDGSFAYSLKAPSRQAHYRAYFAGEASNAASSSGKKLVLPQVWLSAPTRPAPTVARNVAFTSFCYLKPKHPAGTYPVQVRCYLYVPSLGRYSYYGAFSAKASDYDAATSKCTAILKLPYAGQWAIRAYHPADALNAETWSPWNYVVVK